MNIVAYPRYSWPVYHFPADFGDIGYRTGTITIVLSKAGWVAATLVMCGTPTAANE
jgi:hypothetical protein